MSEIITDLSKYKNSITRMHDDDTIAIEDDDGIYIKDETIKQMYGIKHGKLKYAKDGTIYCKNNDTDFAKIIKLSDITNYDDEIIIHIIKQIVNNKHQDEYYYKQITKGGMTTHDLVGSWNIKNIINMIKDINNRNNLIRFIFKECDIKYIKKLCDIDFSTLENRSLKIIIVKTLLLNITHIFTCDGGFYMYDNLYSKKIIYDDIIEDLLEFAIKINDSYILSFLLQHKTQIISPYIYNKMIDMCVKLQNYELNKVLYKYFIRDELDNDDENTNGFAPDTIDIFKLKNDLF